MKNLNNKRHGILKFIYSEKATKFCEILRPSQNRRTFINKRHGSRILNKTASWPNHTSYRKFDSNKFVQNSLCIYVYGHDYF